MYEMSPIAHASKVKAPVFLMVGKNDLRVPPSQSYEFYNTLKSLGKEVSHLRMFQDLIVHADATFLCIRERS